MYLNLHYYIVTCNVNIQGLDSRQWDLLGIFDYGLVFWFILGIVDFDDLKIIQDC